MLRRWLLVTTVMVAPLAAAAEMRVANTIPFDIDVCLTSTSPAIVDRQAGFEGLVATASPAVIECFLPPQHHVSHRAVGAKLAWRLDGGGLKVRIASQDNLSPAGLACVEKVAARLGVAPLPAGTRPLETTTTYKIGDGDLIVNGVNAPSDLNAAIRVAQPSWCACYAGFENEVPPVLQAKITISPGAVKPTSVAVESVLGAENLASCLQSKIGDLSLPSRVTSKVTFPRPFVHLHSGAPDAAGLPPEMAYFQLQRVRARRAAVVAMRVGSVDSSQEAWSKAEEAWRKSRAKDVSPFIRRKKEKCSELLEAEDWAIKGAEELVATDNALLELMSKLPPKWEQMRAELRGSLSGDDEQLAQFRAARKASEESCK